MLKKITALWDAHKARKADEAKKAEEKKEKAWKNDYDARQIEAQRKAQRDAAEIVVIPTIEESNIKFEERYK